jgi:hypothetical protein
VHHHRHDDLSARHAVRPFAPRARRGGAAILHPRRRRPLCPASCHPMDRSTDRRHLKEQRRGARPCPTAYRPY